MLGVLGSEVFPRCHSRMWDLTSARLILSFAALCRLTDIISGANAASIVDLGQLRQEMIVFEIFFLRRQNDLHGLRGGDRGGIEYHPESHRYRFTQGRVVGLSKETIQNPEIPIITSSPRDSRVVFRASRTESL